MAKVSSSSGWITGCSVPGRNYETWDLLHSEIQEKRKLLPRIAGFEKQEMRNELQRQIKISEKRRRESVDLLVLPTCVEPAE